MNSNLSLYCDSLFSYSRFKTREINIGDVPLGANNPIRIQSMTNTDTMNTIATVEQSLRMVNAGSEYVRITAQGIKEAENLAVIKKELQKRGCKVPLIADIHFNPKAAEVAARLVEKVRINPGNYADKKSFQKIDFTETEYNEEIERIRERMFPLIKICKEYGTAIRIGTNHGSLSDRILSRFGDTPLGMVESALEYIRICEDFDFHNIVLSMKSSNVRVMVQANRLLVSRMKAEEMNYPLHLGVTEAGDGEDGRIKSAAGIGALLEDGIGDTLRVSLTEEPENELSVANMLARRYQNKMNASSCNFDEKIPVDPYDYQKRKTAAIGDIGGNNPMVVIMDAGKIPSGVLVPDNTDLPGFRQSFFELMNHNDLTPVIIHRRYSNCTPVEFMVAAAAEISPLLIDGLGDGIWLEAEGILPEIVERTAYNILQATRSRITKTEYIACPSCGRTLYNIQETLRNIRERTSHLKNLKIAVMGCIVNGPGEMADADYGYVGAGKGKITLYKKKEIIKKNIPQSEAVETLIALIKESGDWEEK